MRPAIGSQVSAVNPACSNSPSCGRRTAGIGEISPAINNPNESQKLALWPGVRVGDARRRANRQADTIARVRPDGSSISAITALRARMSAGASLVLWDAPPAEISVSVPRQMVPATRSPLVSSLQTGPGSPYVDLHWWPSASVRIVDNPLRRPGGLPTSVTVNSCFHRQSAGSIGMVGHGVAASYARRSRSPSGRYATSAPTAPATMPRPTRRKTIAPAALRIKRTTRTWLSTVTPPRRWD
jgi:hypothetical protein